MTKKKHRNKYSQQSPVTIPIHGIKVALPPELIFPRRSGEIEIRAIANSIIRSKAKRAEDHTQLKAGGGLDPELLKILASIATNAWRAERRIVDPDTNEPKGDMKLLYRDVNAIRKALELLGVKTIDPTGRAYDSGMALKVISFEPTQGWSKEEIKETIKPSVTWQDHLIQMGEVIVGTPQTTNKQKGE